MSRLHLAPGRFAAFWIRFVWLFALTPALASVPAVAAPAEEKAQTVVHMLDYIGVDYPGFVRAGKVLNHSEYEEQLEFASQAIDLLMQLPARPEQAVLLEQALRLRRSIEDKAAGNEVAALANSLREQVIRAYHLAVAPKQTPDLKLGARLFETNCAACHGVSGHGDGLRATGLSPAPSDFHNAGRMKMRSIYGLYNTITLGVSGTSMQPFSKLSESDRWALAFFVGGVRAAPPAVEHGQQLWQQGRGRAEFGNLAQLVTATPAEVESRGGAELASIQTYLTVHPEALQTVTPSPLALTRAKLAQALQAYRQGDHAAARQLAIGAYLEGFELVEASLDNVDPALRGRAEREMMALRSAIAADQPAAAVAQQIGQIGALLDQVDAKLATGNLSPLAAFVSALLILLREGLEALLVLAAIIAFVVKTGRRDALPYIHMGWVSALALGALTWVAANYLLTITGANREMTEGVTALIAAVMLLYVGYWLHSKSYAQAWQQFIHDQITSALGKRTLWAMAGISFLAVYRELFEIILFYETLWAQAGPEGRFAVLGGIGSAALVLALLGWGILKYSVRLPIGPFFSATSGLLALMAVVFAGNGVAALQEAGVIGASLVPFVSLPLLGIHPTAQGLFLQVAVLGLVLAGIVISRRKALAR